MLAIDIARDAPERDKKIVEILSTLLGVGGIEFKKLQIHWYRIDERRRDYLVHNICCVLKINIK